mmetsp:Transcript_26976/g.79700  ORF Transcript_26976/g.79700 Transcript_26976/m.79700 type:complete len:508 (-) Transcript_26976:881-2404(-)
MPLRRQPRAQQRQQFPPPPVGEAELFGAEAAAADLQRVVAGLAVKHAVGVLGRRPLVSRSQCEERVSHPLPLPRHHGSQDDPPAVPRHLGLGPRRGHRPFGLVGLESSLGVDVPLLQFRERQAEVLSDQGLHETRAELRAQQCPDGLLGPCDGGIPRLLLSPRAVRRRRRERLRRGHNSPPLSQHHHHLRREHAHTHAPEPPLGRIGVVLLAVQRRADEPRLRREALHGYLTQRRAIQLENGIRRRTQAQRKMRREQGRAALDGRRAAVQRGAVGLVRQARPRPGRRRGSDVRRDGREKTLGLPQEQPGRTQECPHVVGRAPVRRHHGQELPARLQVRAAQCPVDLPTRSARHEVPGPLPRPRPQRPERGDHRLLRPPPFLGHPRRHPPQCQEGAHPPGTAVLDDKLAVAEGAKHVPYSLGAPHPYGGGTLKGFRHGRQVRQQRRPAGRVVEQRRVGRCEPKVEGDPIVRLGQEEAGEGRSGGRPLGGPLSRSSGRVRIDRILCHCC